MPHFRFLPWHRMGRKRDPDEMRQTPGHRDNTIGIELHNDSDVDANTISDSVSQGLSSQCSKQGSQLEVWKATVLCRVNGHGGPISSLLFLSGGNRIASTRRGSKAIQLWSLNTMPANQVAAPTEPPMVHGVAVSAMAASMDGTRIISGTDDGKVVIWDAETCQKLDEFPVGSGKKIRVLDISPDSSRAASGSDDGAVFIWFMEASERDLNTLVHQIPSAVSSLRFSPVSLARGHIAAGYFHSCSILIWESRTRAQLMSISTGNQPTWSLAWSADGRRLFAGSSRGSIRFFDVTESRGSGSLVLRSFAERPSAPITLLFIPNSGQLLISASCEGRTIDIWDIRDVSSLKCLFSLAASNVLGAAITQDGTRLISGGTDNSITLRSVTDIVDKSYFLHCLPPFSSEMEPVGHSVEAAAWSHTLLVQLIYISTAAYQAWRNGNLEETERILLKDLEVLKDRYSQDLVRCTRGNLAFVRVRLQKWSEALGDTEITMSTDIRAPPIAYIAKSVAFHRLGMSKESMDTFESVLCQCNGDLKHFVECIMSIILSYEHNEDGHCIYDIPNDCKGFDLNALVNAWRHFLLAKRSLSGLDQDYNTARKMLQILDTSPNLEPLFCAPEWMTSLLILLTGWDIHGLALMIDELRNQSEATLSSLCERFGDQAMCCGVYNEAAQWYTEALILVDRVPDTSRIRLFLAERAPDTASNHTKNDAIGEWLDMLSRCPSRPARLYVKRSKGRAFTHLWEEALSDADRAIEQDQLCARAYQMRHLALHTLQRYEESVITLSTILKLKDMDDPAINELRVRYSKAMAVIDEEMDAIFEKTPFVLIDVENGKLCDIAARRQTFKEDPTFYKLASCASGEFDTECIKQVVERYFSYVMFSHTWEGKEPSFHDVLEISVYELPPLPENEKLRKFCEMVRGSQERYRWSWSDTCCINKKDKEVYEKSIRFMYKWYYHSALTLVLLADIRMSRPPGSRALEHNRWMFRAWTLQELLAPRTIRFYDRNWNLYQNDSHPNHKNSPEIVEALAKAIDVPLDAIVHFTPRALTVRTRLRLASSREATVKVDIAYSLIGIFDSDLDAEYSRDAEIALGLLLQEVVSRRKEITVLDWHGESSKFNSSLPADLSVYKRTPYILPCVSDEQIHERIASLRAAPQGLQQDAIKLYNDLSIWNSHLRFSDRRLSLPCIAFSTVIDASGHGHGNTAYLAKVAVLGNLEVEIKTTNMSSPLHGRAVLVYPWISDLFARIRQDGGQPDKYTQALKLIAHLEQGFRALLFVEESAGRHRRVAVDKEISVPGMQLTSLEEVSVQVLEIWEN